MDSTVDLSVEQRQKVDPGAFVIMGGVGNGKYRDEWGGREGGDGFWPENRAMRCAVPVPEKGAKACSGPATLHACMRKQKTGKTGKAGATSVVFLVRLVMAPPCDSAAATLLADASEATPAVWRGRSGREFGQGVPSLRPRWQRVCAQPTVDASAQRVQRAKEKTHHGRWRGSRWILCGYGVDRLWVNPTQREPVRVSGTLSGAAPERHRNTCQAGVEKGQGGIVGARLPIRIVLEMKGG
mgnify:CR=1 FL=1